MRGPTVVIAVFAVLLAGCSDTSSDGGTPTPEVTTSSENTSEPAPEPTEPETTQTQQAQPSIEIPSLPVGGSPIEDHPNCTSVSLTDASIIPAGTTIKLGAPDFDPKDIFDAEQSACPDSLRACEGIEWTADQHDTCYIGVHQVAKTGSTTLRVPGKVTCASQADCDSLEGKSGSQILLTASSGG